MHPLFRIPSSEQIVAFLLQYPKFRHQDKDQLIGWLAQSTQLGHTQYVVQNSTLEKYVWYCQQSFQKMVRTCILWRSITAAQSSLTGRGVLFTTTCRCHCSQTTRSSFETRPKSCWVFLRSKKLKVNPPFFVYPENDTTFVRECGVRFNEMYPFSY